MDYETGLTDELSDRIAHEFFRGYKEIRSFTDEEAAVLPEMYALIGTFARSRQNDLASAVEDYDTAKIGSLLDDMEHSAAMKRNIL